VHRDDHIVRRDPQVHFQHVDAERGRVLERGEGVLRAQARAAAVRDDVELALVKGVRRRGLGEE
jgi:hypothetical protein